MLNRRPGVLPVTEVKMPGQVPPGKPEQPAFTSVRCAVPIWEDGVVVGEPRQANVTEGGIQGRELGIAVGRQIDARVRVAIERVSERERDGGDQIIRVITYVRRACHNAAAYLLYGVLAARRWCCGRCWRGWRSGRRRRRRRRCWHIPGSLDHNWYWPTGLKEANCCIRRIWRLVRIKPKVKQRPRSRIALAF